MDRASCPTGAILCVVGARPNYMKMAPLLRALRARPELPAPVLVHTGQHYDPLLNERLFADLELPRPDINLAVGSGTHAVQTAEVMRGFEPLLDTYQPTCVIVVGDVNSTFACSLVAAKKGVPIAHVEAGLRSYDRSMPEEINRVLTDQLADLLYTTERSAHPNLKREGIADERVHFVGNLMIDSLLEHRARAIPAAETLTRAGATPEVLAAAEGFGVVTLHRPSNVDDPDALAECVHILRSLSEVLPLVCALHPRTQSNIASFGLAGRLASERLIVLPPQGYLEMLGLMSEAKLVVTDSGGIQEETTALGVPCLTMRDNTERPITVEQGTNILVGRDQPRILRLAEQVIATGGKRGRVPELWDGKAAQRIARHLADWIPARAPLLHA
ncbi:MAG TPA: UDP-N-acetylglucosamine 2-epimerase (non-hydrolyzing) [Burkholderiales bacterium]|nr:UDP-N-acetylglucosamine 2-epimerase (non-hydrolyzing) [Burkholderiales bacterium]